MEGDEDLAMGGMDSSTLGSLANTMPVPSMNGKADPVLGLSPLAQSLQHPLPPRPPSHMTRDAMPITDGRPIPPLALVDTAEVHDMSSVAHQDNADSLAEEKSDVEGNVTTGLPLAQLPSGLCYDVRMRYHCEVRPTVDVHPEDPRRIYYIYKELCRAGLVDDQDSLKPLTNRPLKRIYARDATEEEISSVHTPEHYLFVQSTRDMCDEELIALEHTRDSIYFNRLTFASAILSAGGAIETCLAVANREVKNAIAIIRPPGHHAEHAKTMGFCLFNNVSIAARVCQKQLGEMCRRILILDWDVHHGNGIQEAFYEDPNILYISLHVYQDGKFYPGGDEGDATHCGAGPGLGRNVNVPWPQQGMGDGDYMYAFQQIVMPIAREFNPDLVIVAAGFDAAAGDELGGCFVTPACYAHMIHMLMTLANGKVAVCLEGGYNFRSISKSALAVTKTLMGEPPDRLISTTPSDAAAETVGNVIRIQSRFWSCMYPRPPREKLIWTDRLNDVIRSYQHKQLYDNYKLTTLYIYRTSISKSFENQVLASTNYNKAVPLFVIFHDPPEIIGIPHSVTNELEVHNCWLADVVKDYVSWAAGNNYAVIDVNIPKHAQSDPTPGTYEEEDANRLTATEELAGYLWDNYIEPNNATDIFFMGVGNAFYGIANLLINRDTLYQRINGVISFVAENPIRAVASHTQVWLSRWYKEHSLVFVSHAHAVWTGSGGRRKPSKRYGTLVQSPKRGLNEMLLEHKENVFEWIKGRIKARDSSVPESEDTEMGLSIKTATGEVRPMPSR